LVQKSEENNVFREASAEERKVLEMCILLEKRGKKVNFIPEQATTAQKGSRCIALLFP